MPVNGASQQMHNALLAWEGVEAAPHRFGGLEYRLGTREIGHVHGDWLVDIPFPTKIRDEIVSAGLVQPHHILPESGWVSFYLQKPQDIQAAIALFKRSYEITAKQKRLKTQDIES